MAQFDNAYGLPPEYLPQQQDISRQLKLADMLRQQSQAPLEGQMVSGHYVAPSITQYLAKALQGYNANQYDKQATQQQTDLYKGFQNSKNEAFAKILQGANPKQVQVGESSKLPAFEPNQLDQFGSPLPNAQRTPVTTPVMQAETPDQVQARVRPMLYEYANKYGNDPSVQMLVGQLDHQRDRGEHQQDVKEQYAHEDTVRSGEHAFQAEQNAQSRALQENLQKLGFSHAEAMQIASQKFQAGENAKTRAQQKELAGVNAPPVAVLGPDGKPQYVARNDAIGKQPYSAKQEAQDALKVQQAEQAKLSAQQVLDQAGLLMNHPGRKAGTGGSYWMSNIPATDAKDFKANLDTFKAQTFIPMVSALKGMGALSDAEGKKLSESVGALDPSMSEKAFADSLRQVTKTLYDKARANGLNVSMPEFASDQPVNQHPEEINNLLKKYGR